MIEEASRERQHLQEMLWVGAQLLSRIEADLMRLRGVLLDMRGEIQASEVESSIPTMSRPEEPRLEVAPEPCIQPPVKRRPGQSRALVWQVFEGVEGELTLQDIFTRIQAITPDARLDHLRPILSNLTKEGRLTRVRQGVYQAVPIKIPLQFARMRCLAIALMLLMGLCHVGIAQMAVGSDLDGRQPQWHERPECCVTDAQMNLNCAACPPEVMQRWLGFRAEASQHAPTMVSIGDRFAWDAAAPCGTIPHFRVMCAPAFEIFGAQHSQIVPYDREPSVIMSELVPPIARGMEYQCAVRCEDRQTMTAGPWSPPVRIMIRP